MANKEWLKKGADGLSFGERLGDLITNSKTRAYKLAEATEIPQSAISDYLNKDRAPDCATICTLARHFSVSTDYLLGLTDITSPNTDVQAIVSMTGLTESNIVSIMNTWKYIAKQDASSEFMRCINDFIEVATSKKVLNEDVINGTNDIMIEYLLMLSSTKTPSVQVHSNLQECKEIVANSLSLRNNGYVVISGEEAFHYHCSRLADIIEREIIRKYSPSAKWSENHG